MFNLKGLVLAERFMSRKTILISASLGALLIYLTSTILNYYFMDMYMAHGMCFMWSLPLIITVVVGDSLIALSYYIISGCLIYSVLKRNIKGHFMNLPSLYFGLFIFLCGTTHIFSIITIWIPIYWTAATITVVTALVSFLVAVVVLSRIRYLVNLPHIGDILKINRKLQRKVDVLRATSLSTVDDTDLNVDEELKQFLDTLKKVTSFIGRLEQNGK